MKVSIPVRKTVTETIQLPQLPYYSCRFGSIYYMITEKQFVVQVTKHQIVFWEPNDTYYGEHLVDAYRADVCTQKDFDAVLAATKENINAVLNPAKGAVTHTMNTDPNLQQASEQEAAGQAQADVANEQVAAAEQEAQEQAMESAEEGSTEG